MSEYKIYHNPRCSKSRQTLELLEQNGIKPEVILYKESGLTKEEVLFLKECLNVASALNFIRTKEEAYKAAGIDSSDEEQLMDLLVLKPEILERPIVVKAKQAVIGRPPVAVLNLISIQQSAN